MKQSRRTYVSVKTALSCFVSKIYQTAS